MNLKEFLKPIVAALILSLWIIAGSYFHYWPFEKITIERPIYTFLILFTGFSILLILTSLLKEKAPEKYKRLEDFLDWTIYKSRWAGLLTPGLTIPYYSWIREKILREYDISKKESWKISSTLSVIWLCIILSGLVIFVGGLAFLLINFKVSLPIAIIIGIIAVVLSGFYYSFMLKRFYWQTFSKLLKKYKKKEE